MPCVDRDACHVANPARQRWAEESGLPEEVLVEVANKKLTDVTAVTPEHVALIQELADKFTAAGEIPEKVDIAAVVEPGLIE